jgi:hypothetical protein
VCTFGRVRRPDKCGRVVASKRVGQTSCRLSCQSNNQSVAVNFRPIQASSGSNQIRLVGTGRAPPCPCADVPPASRTENAHLVGALRRFARSSVRSRVCEAAAVGLGLRTPLTMNAGRRALASDLSYPTQPICAFGTFGPSNAENFIDRKFYVRHRHKVGKCSLKD